ncbi:ATP-binding protein [Thiomicrorhabdus sp. Kp2]|uniref:ATP-binding protein n=1 Tax=Thiomicrorhabdus sp. Kp2 TaxID=1123518 RepID=UPI000405166C|nr:ATP-binding protein [Thiomicrorhabdus sp. Kp2]
MKTLKRPYLNHTPRNLFLLLLIFIFGIGSQAVLNLSISNFISELDQRVQNSEVENLLGQEIILEIHKIESDFFQMAAFPNKHLRKILIKDILKQQEAIKDALTILNEGGIYKHHIDLNLPNTERQFDILLYKPEIKDMFSFSRSDILPKFTIINSKMDELTQRLEEIDLLRKTNSPKLSEAITELKLQVKFIKPLFVRIKEDANHIFHQNKLHFKQTRKEVEAQKKFYQNIQISLTLSVFILGLIAFYTLSRNIRNTTQEIQTNQDYTQDILDSQSNIIIVNDGVNIIDASGGFFKFFSNYPTLDAFAKDYTCICDLFVKEPGLVYKFEDKNWIEFLIKNPEQTHKAKINYQGVITTFQLNAVKSDKYHRYIISMFDISGNEKTNRILQEQKNQALEATQAKGAFLANMSHEIRTPLNAILGFIGLLKDKTHDEESTKYLDTIDNSSHSLLGIINDILDFSKIESGKLNIDPVVFNPIKEFSSTADLFRARCSEKQLTFSIELSETLPNGLKCDVLRIKQVLSNLISNAIKFTDSHKSIYLEISYAHGYLHFSVKDQGIGISKEAQEHIFEAFAQAETSTTRKYGGTGLGLAISAKLVQMLGGELHVESTLGKGSRFYFSVPAKIVEITERPALQSLSASQLAGHILLVEDNKTNQLLMSAILTKQGITFDLAEDGLEAVSAVTKNHYDLVLMDENMPNLNGIEATKQIREWEQQQNLNRLPIIALTANAMTGDRERFVSAGMDEYLTKPVNIPKLHEIFRLYLTSSV